MLKELHLTDIILIESIRIPFAKGFNVLSGESGSGKSAIMNALHLIAGERSDPSTIRHGADKGSVEALFEIDDLPGLLKFLETSGIDHESGQDLLIRRELSSSGKSRAFINHQSVQLSLLKQVSHHLFDLTGQHANQKLFLLDYHRHALDLYGDLSADVAVFSAIWHQENETRNALEELIGSEAQRLREIEICKRELEELQEAAIKEGEEEETFAEYAQLAHADDLMEKTGILTHLFTGEKHGVLTQLSRQKSTVEQLVRLAPALSETATHYENLLIELHEISHVLHNFQNRIERNPERVASLNERLELITQLKRKYGPSVADLQNYMQKTAHKLASLEQTDLSIDELRTETERLAAETQARASHLTAKRKAIASEMQKAIEEQLRGLNMPKVEFFIDITPQKRGPMGDDKVEFFLVPNVGEQRISLRECASGGELSRTMLALQVVLAGKEKTPTLVFDEVDANMGGETAAMAGSKMKKISANHQVLCITHFPQVAKQAQHHLRIFKEEIDGRTLTLVECLEKEPSRQRELKRMLGEKSV